jgi:hypothetical protein
MSQPEAKLEILADAELDAVAGGWPCHSSTQEIKCPIGSLIVYINSCGTLRR